MLETEFLLHRLALVPTNNKQNSNMNTNKIKGIPKKKDLGRLKEFGI